MRVRPTPPRARGDSPPGVRSGAVVTVRVPASSANLGPAYDSLGLALRLYDEVRLEVRPSGLDVEVDVEGHGADRVPRNEQHLVVRAARAAFEAAGAGRPGLRLHCRNDIPHGRGLGSSAAAVVAGLLAARGALVEPRELDDDAVLALATRFDGHPDNAAAALLGACTIAWRTEAGAPRAVRFEPHPLIDPVLCVPAGGLSTARARAMLPVTVPHDDAAFNVGRSALLVDALSRRPDMLMEATEDRLHQPHRASAMPVTAMLVDRLRSEGAAAVVSGAGPTVIVLGTGDQLAAVVTNVLADPLFDDWRMIRPGVDTFGATTTTEGYRRGRDLKSRS